MTMIVITMVPIQIREGKGDKTEELGGRGWIYGEIVRIGNFQ